MEFKFASGARAAAGKAAYRPPGLGPPLTAEAHALPIARGELEDLAESENHIRHQQIRG